MRFVKKKMSLLPHILKRHIRCVKSIFLSYKTYININSVLFPLGITQLSEDGKKQIILCFFPKHEFKNN